MFEAFVTAVDSADKWPIVRVDAILVNGQSWIGVSRELTSLDIAAEIALFIAVRLPHVVLKSALTFECSRTQLN